MSQCHQVLLIFHRPPELLYLQINLCRRGTPNPNVCLKLAPSYPYSPDLKFGLNSYPFSWLFVVTNAVQRDDGMFSVGQTLRIRVGPLKGYICRVLAVRRSDVTVKLDSQHKILTGKVV